MKFGVVVPKWDFSLKLMYQIDLVGADKVKMIDGAPILNQGGLGLCGESGVAVQVFEMESLEWYCEFESYFRRDLAAALTVEVTSVNVLFIKPFGEDAVIISFRFIPLSWQQKLDMEWLKRREQDLVSLVSSLVFSFNEQCIRQYTLGQKLMRSIKCRYETLIHLYMEETSHFVWTLHGVYLARQQSYARNLIDSIDQRGRALRIYMIAVKILNDVVEDGIATILPTICLRQPCKGLQGGDTRISRSISTLKIGARVPLAGEVHVPVMPGIVAARPKLLHQKECIGRRLIILHWALIYLRITLLSIMGLF